MASYQPAPASTPPTVGQIDGNSPIDISGQTNATFQFAGDYSEVDIIPSGDNEGFRYIRVNQNTGTYRFLQEDGGNLAGSEVDIGERTNRVGRIRLQYSPFEDEVGIIIWTQSNGSPATRGYLDSAETGIDSIDFYDPDSKRSLKATVVGRQI